jgi:4-hydroxy-tetrahydrodipicolinate synthase
MTGLTFRGCYTAIITPFRAGGIDHDGLRALIERQVEAGVSGVVPCGTTGESPTLSHAEHREVIRATVEAAAGRIAVIAGCGSNATDEAISLTRYAAEVGADATLQVVPYYNRPQQEGLYRHFRAIAEAAPLPVVLYNIPGRSGIDLLPETVARLAQIGNIRAIKEATGSLIRACQSEATGLALLSGDDALTLPMLSVGGAGVISVASNVVPAEMQALCERYFAGDADGALEIHKRLWPLMRALFCESNPVPVKWAAAELFGLSPEVRLPLAPLSGSGQETVRAALDALALASA